MLRRLPIGIALVVLVCAHPCIVAAQQNAAAPAATAGSAGVPNLVNYSGVLKDVTGHPLTSITGVTFLLYKDEQGGSPLWLETQNVTPEKTGHYSVQLGATTAAGLPPDLFVTGEARWLALQIANEPEQPRVLLVAVPYAMKAADAATIGGLPPSAFMLAPVANSNASAGGMTNTTTNLSTANGAVTGLGVIGNLPLWDTTSDIISSVVSQTGSGATAKIGINNAAPSTTLDVKGNATIRGPASVQGQFSLPSGTATATTGKTSAPLDFYASAFNSLTATAVPQIFQWQAEPVNNDTSTASGSMNLLFAFGTNKPAETGLHIASNGQITFAAGQTFPGTGTGNGTVTSVGSGSGLTGGPITTSGTLSIASGGVTNAMLANPSLTVSAGTALTGGGSVSLGGSTTLNLNTALVPLLASANKFTAEQTMSSGISTTFIDTTSVNVFDPGFSEFIGSEPSYIILVENNEGGNGIISYNEATSGDDAGVYGASTGSSIGVGVYGQQGAESGSASTVYSLDRGIGVFGDGGTTTAGMGVAGTATEGDAGYFRNNSSTGWQTVWVQADNSGTADVFEAYNSATGHYCYIDSGGNINCTGSKNAVVPIDGGARLVALSAIESPKNWFEDFGSAELVHGSAVVSLDSVFTQTVNTDREYQVFLTPYGDCKGLYVSNRTPNSFEVHELGGGSSSLSFGYRITAIRRKYEDVRFADHTDHIELAKRMQMRALTGPLHSHTPNLNLQPRPASPKAMLAPAATKSQAR